MQQLSLFGDAFTPRRRDGVFFCLRPPPGARETIFKTGRRIRAAHALVGPEMAVDALHLSLHGLAASADEAAWVLIEAGRAMAAVDTPAFQVRFDHVISWNGSLPRRPLVLLPDAPTRSALVRFWRDVGEALNVAGLPAARKFEPHVTLGRYPEALPEQPVPPISWTVDAFDLVWSHYGQGRHSLLNRAPLPEAARASAP